MAGNVLTPKYRFESQGLDKDTFSVIKFNGSEGISQLYAFDIYLVSKQNEIDPAEVLRNRCTFSIQWGEEELPFHGQAAMFSELQQIGKYYCYRAELVPRLWRLHLTKQNQFFLDKQPADFLKEVLEQNELCENVDFEFRLQNEYREWEYVCQYNESYFNFFSRWLEHYGIYYYFEQSADREKCIITDTKLAHDSMPQGKLLKYSEQSGLDGTYREEVIKNFRLKQYPMPRTVKLKDYNYRTPDVNMEVSAIVDAEGRGEVYSYGEHYRTPTEGKRLAEIRAQEVRSREREYRGNSNVPFLRSGYQFELSQHFRERFNQEYVTIKVDHQGAQSEYLVDGLGLNVTGDGLNISYVNNFIAIPANVQFHPERKTQPPKFTGSMNAVIDAEGNGEYAEVDDQGRYKVVLPMDCSSREDGKSSAWLRMAQPYVGSNHGMHMPLHKGTEVLIICIDGNPDRPVIAAAVPNPNTPSAVTNGNQTKCVITSSGQNKIHMQDQDGAQNIVLQSPQANTWMRFGAPNDPPASADGEGIDFEFGDWEEHSKGCRWYTEGSYTGEVDGDYKIKIGCNSTTITVGSSLSVFAGLSASFKLAANLNVSASIDANISLGAGCKAALLYYDFTAEVNKATGDFLRFFGAKTNIGVEKMNVEGAVTKLQTEVSEINAVLAKINATKEEVNAIKTEVNEREEIVIDNSDEVINMHNSIMNDLNKLIENEINITNIKTTTSTNNTEINTNKTESNTNKTDSGVNYDALYTIVSI